MLARITRILGVVLVLGGTAHFLGVTHLYVTHGRPEINRILLDLWIGEAQILGGALYLVASRALRRGEPARVLIVFGALTVIGYAAPFLPVLFHRAQIPFRIMPTVYLFGSVVLLAMSKSKVSQRE